MKKLVTTSGAWVVMLLMSLFAFSSGNAQQPCGITVSPADEVLFESVQGAAIYKVFNVTNTTSESITVYVFTTGEDTTAFTYDAHSFTIAGNGHKEFKVWFKPNLSNTLRYGAMLNFTTNTGTICQSVELIGTGGMLGGGDKGLISDPGSYKYPATDLGSQSCKTFVIKNMATVAATISNIRLEGPAFALGAFTVPMTIDANGTFNLDVCYKPVNQTDLYAKGTVVVEYVLANTSETRKLYINLTSGENSGGDQVVIIDPAQYKFPATDIGQTFCKDFRIVNKTNMKALIQSFNFEGSAEFTVTSSVTLPVEISAGDSLYLRVCFTPTSTSSELKGSISINYSFDGGTTVKHSSATFYAVIEKPQCVSSEGTDAWKEPILIGGKADRELIVTNKTASPITITEIRLAGEDVKAFTITAQTPITIPAMSKVTIPFTFAPYAINGVNKEKYIAAVVLTLSSDPATDCTVHEGHVWGYSLHGQDKDSSKSVAISLFPDEKQTIGLANRGIKESYTLLFKNNLDKDVIVQSISLMDGTKFKIAATDPATTPFTLKPSETFTVTIEFESADGLLYKDKLVIVSDFAATALEFDLQGINAEIASVRSTLPEGVTVALVPNPMRSNTTVDLEGVRSATIEVSDILGSTIMSAATTGDWNWNGRMANGAVAPAGTYFVRIQAESTNGERFVTTQRVVIDR